MNKKKKNGIAKHLDFILLDIVYIQLAYILAYFVRNPQKLFFRGTTLYLHLDVVLMIIDICYVLLCPVYKGILKRGAWKEIQSVILHNVVLWLAAIAYLYLTQQAYWFSRGMLVLAVFLSVAFMLAGRLFWKEWVRSRMRKGKNQSSMLLVTDREHAEKIIERLQNRKYYGFHIIGLAIMDDNLEGKTISGVPVLCSRDTLLDYVRKEVVDDALIKLRGSMSAHKKLVDEFLEMGVVVHMALDYDEQEFPNAVMERIGGYNCLTTSISSAGSLQLMIKRLIDIAAGLVGTVATGILFLIFAPLIYKASPGPIFFSQERVGKNGRRFKIYKFRSMYMDAEERKAELMAQNKMSGLMFKLDNDPRIIGSEKGPGKGIGNLIRKLSIDEFPQFINILKGDMSLVGTRPPTVQEFEEYESHHKIRLSMKPGLTGMWQVSGRSDITDFEEIVRLDASYIENWSLALDFKIIFKTVLVVLQHKGAE